MLKHRFDNFIMDLRWTPKVGCHWGEYGMNLTFFCGESRPSGFAVLLALESPADGVEGAGII